MNPDAFFQAVTNISSPHVLLAILAAAVYGIFVGAIPGLTATMAVALMVPMTFFMDDLSAMAAIVTVVACSIFAGDIPTALVRIPGTPASAAYADDAYNLTKRGLHLRALGICLVSSVFGGLLGAIVLCSAAWMLAPIAANFSSYEYFWFYALGLSSAAIVSHGSRLKGALALVIGLLFATVGLSSVHSVPRFTFGRDELVTGINFIPAMIGLFGASEVLRNALHLRADDTAGLTEPPVLDDASRRGLSRWLQPVFGGMLKRITGRWPHVFRSSGTGVVIGMVPGAGADIGAWVSYSFSKKFSKTPEEYGKGSEEGLADATTANNAALAGAWVPALVFGVPGDSVTAIAIGVLLMKNVHPGHDIFTNPSTAPLVYGIYLAFFLANLLLIPIGFLAIRTGALLVRIPRRVLLPIILFFCIVGSYALNGSYFDVSVMLAMGIVGFVLEELGIPLGPVVLGIILGGDLEAKFVQNLSKDGSLLSFFSRPWAAVMGAACVALWILPPLIRVMKKPSR